MPDALLIVDPYTGGFRVIEKDEWGNKRELAQGWSLEQTLRDAAARANYALAFPMIGDPR